MSHIHVRRSDGISVEATESPERLDTILKLLDSESLIVERECSCGALDPMVCPRCKGTGCELCKDSGWLTRQLADGYWLYVNTSIDEALDR